MLVRSTEKTITLILGTCLIDKVVIFSLSFISLVKNANCELFSLTLTLLSLIFFFFFFAQDSGLLGGLDIHLLILSKERGFLFFLGSLVVIFFF